MAGNEFLVFAEGPGSNLPTQAEYAASPLRTTGNVPGIARSAINNKAILQSSLMAAAVAQFIADNQLDDVVDTLTPGELVVMFINALTEQFIPQGAGIEVPGGAVADNAMVLWDGPTGTMVKTAGTGAAGLPSGTIAQRPASPNPGMLRYNSQTSRGEIFNGTSWVDITGDLFNTVRIDVASAATINLTSSAPNTRHINITGTTAITGFGVAAGQCYFVRFADATTLTNSASLITQFGANIATQPGDTCIIRATADNVVEVLCYRSIKRKVRGTAVATTSGTSHDVTGIPSWANKITITFDGVSVSAASIPQIQLGAGSIETTGYLGSAMDGLPAGTTAMLHSTGFLLGSLGNAAYTRHGSIVLTRVTGNTWAVSGVLGLSDTARGQAVGGTKALSGTLDRFRLTTVNGTDLFDAGQFNYDYEE